MKKARKKKKKRGWDGGVWDWIILKISDNN